MKISVIIPVYNEAKTIAEIVKKVEDIKKKVGGNVDQTESLKIKAMIKEVDGNNDLATITSFVSTMPVKDTKAFRKYANSIEPGIMMVQDSTCTFCGNETKEVIPLRENFFWPDS